MKHLFTFKKRASGTTGQVVLSRIIAIICSIFLVGLILLIFLPDKSDFGNAMSKIFIDRFFTENIKMTIKDAVPLIIVTLGIAVAFRMKLWNIGGNGQMIAGCMFAYGAWLYGQTLPRYVLIPLMIVAALLGGACCAAVMAFTKAFLNVNETITSLMMNYIMAIFGQYLISAGSNPGPWNEGKGFEKAATITDNALLTQFGRSGVTTSVFIAIILLLLYYFVIMKSKWGYEIRVTGESNTVARYAGMPVKRNVLITLLLSGAIAGVAGYCILAGTGYKTSFAPGAIGNLGFTAVMIAWLSRLNPWGIAAMTFFFAGITNGANALQSYHIDKSFAEFIQGTILMVILAFDFITRYEMSCPALDRFKDKIKSFFRKNGKKNAVEEEAVK